MRDDVRNATASATDSLWRHAAEQRRKAEAEQREPFDPDCRFGARSTEHRCVDPFGAPVRLGGSCFLEANAQMHDQARRERFEREHAFADAAGLPASPPCCLDES